MKGPVIKPCSRRAAARRALRRELVGLRTAAEGQFVRLPERIAVQCSVLVALLLAGCAAGASPSELPAAEQSGMQQTEASDGVNAICAALRYYLDQHVAEAPIQAEWLHVVDAGSETERVVNGLASFPVSSTTPSLESNIGIYRETASTRLVAFWRAKLLHITASEAEVSVWCNKGAVSGFQANVFLSREGEQWVVARAHSGIVS